MWSQYYQANVCQLLRKSILSLCSESVPYDDKLEIDGIICISAGDEGKQIVVKVHEVLENLHSQVWPVSVDDTSPGGLRPNVTNLQIGPNAGILNGTQVAKCFYQKETQEDQHRNVETKRVHRQNGHSQPRSQSLQVKPGKSGEELIDMKQENVSNPETAGAGTQRTHLSRQGFSEVGKQAPKEMIRQSQLPCQDIFPGRRPVSRYRQQHLIDLKHQGDLLCKICGSRYTNFALLNIHNLDVHRRFTCRQCFNTFSMPCNLRRHERLHAGRKPYNCRFCAQGFSRNGDLRLHELRHRSGSSYRMHCSRCLKSFNKKKALRLHKCVALKDVLSRLSIRQAQKLQESDLEMNSTIQTNESCTQPLAPSSIRPCREDSDFRHVNNKMDKRGPENKEEETKRLRMSPQIRAGTLSEEVVVQQRDGEGVINATKRELEYLGSQLKNHQEIADCKCPTIKNEVGVKLQVLHSTPHVKDDYDKQGSLLKGLFESTQVQNSVSSGRIVFPGQDSYSGGVSNIMANGNEPTPKETLSFRQCGNMPFSSYLSPRVIFAMGNCTSSSTKTADENQYVDSIKAEVSGRERSNSPSEAVVDVKAEQSPDQSPSYISLNRRYWCRLCKSQWDTFKTYEEHHIRQHLRYPCHFCNQTFSNKNNRSRHIRSHTGQKQHACPECGKCFSRSDTLKEHQIIHTDGYLGDKCNYCHVVIKKKAELLGHIKKCSQRYKHGGVEGRPLRAEQPSILLT